MGMLYCVQMDVRVPHDVDPALFNRFKAEQKARVQAPQREGKWRHRRRIAGQCSDVSVFDASSHNKLHAILSGLALFPFMTVSVTPLAQRLSAIHTER